MCGKTIKSNSDNRIKHPLLYDEKWMHEKLVEEQWSQRRVARVVGCTQPRVKGRIQELGWGHLQPRKKLRDSKHRQIIDLLKAGNLTRKQIAEQCNVNTSLVNNVIYKYGIKPGTRIHYPLLRDRDWLYRKLITEQLPYAEVAEMVGCSAPRVRKLVRELGWRDMRPLRAKS